MTRNQKKTAAWVVGLLAGVGVIGAVAYATSKPAPASSGGGTTPPAGVTTITLVQGHQYLLTITGPAGWNPDPKTLSTALAALGFTIVQSVTPNSLSASGVYTGPTATIPISSAIGVPATGVTVQVQDQGVAVAGKNPGPLKGYVKANPFQRFVRGT